MRDPKGYYKILGLNPGDSIAKVKAAYAKKQHELHPSGRMRREMRESPEYKKLSDEERMKKEKELDDLIGKVNEAYNVLGFEAKKKEYDEGTGEFATSQFGDFEMMGGGFPFSEFFSEFSGRSEKRQQSKVKDTVTEIKISMKEAFTGKKSKFRIKVRKVCEKCNGKGSASVSKCATCHGSGVMEMKKKFGVLVGTCKVECTKCSGCGEVPNGPVCVECNGAKVTSNAEIVEIDIAPGVQNGTKIIFRGRGNQAPNCRSGDVIFVIQITPNPKFTRIDNHIVSSIDIDILTALAGGVAQVEHLDGRIFNVKIAPFKNFEDSICIPGEGFRTSSSSHAAGDLYLKPKIHINQSLSRAKLSEYLKPLINPIPDYSAKDVSAIMKKIPAEKNNSHGNDDDEYTEFSQNDFFRSFRFF